LAIVAVSGVETGKKGTGRNSPLFNYCQRIVFLFENFLLTIQNLGPKVGHF